MRIALLHLAPRLGDLAYNRRLLEAGIDTAAGIGAEWVVTPELCLTGYDFAGILGTDWIVKHDASVEHFQSVAAQKKLTLFLCHPERDEDTLDLYISVYVIASDGAILGTHRKTCVIPEVEAWSNRGGDPSPVIVPPVQTGILICADAYTARASERLRERGAQLLISSAAWGPRPHGPERCWEERSRETGLPLFVCNRTGKDRALDFWEAESVVVNDGKRLLSYSGLDSTAILINWNLETQALMDHTIRKLAVGPLTEP